MDLYSQPPIQNGVENPFPFKKVFWKNRFGESEGKSLIGLGGQASVWSTDQLKVYVS